MSNDEHTPGRLAGKGIRRGPDVPFRLDGREIPAFAGESVAACLLAEGQRTLRRTARKGELRGIYCGIGLCHDCAVEVDGRPGVRTCMMPVAPGSFSVAEGLVTEGGEQKCAAVRPVDHEMTRDAIVIGGGPAGMAAAVELAAARLTVTLLDERPQLGGQVYRRPPAQFSVTQPDRQGKHYNDGARLIAEAGASQAEILTGHTAWGVWREDGGFRVAAAGPEGGKLSLRAPRLIVASGAYDRPFPFPGWTLPGVMTAGGAQQLAKAQRIAPGARVVVAGSGPLIPFFAVELHKLGVNVVAVAEACQRPGALTAARFAWDSLAGGARHLLMDGLGYLSYLRRHRIPMHWGTAIAEARGDEVLREVVLRRVDAEWNPLPGSERAIEADCVCVNYGFKPSTEIAALMGCEFDLDEQLGGRIPRRSPAMETSVPGLFAAGDGAGIGGSVLARLEGRIAGMAAAMDAGADDRGRLKAAIAGCQRDVRRFRRFKSGLDAVYRMGPGIRRWWTPETTLCRCEEVTYREVMETAARVGDPNLVKVMTRAGMGRCQGRYCHDNLLNVIGSGCGAETRGLTPRLPLKPVPLGVIADESIPPRRNVPHGKLRVES